VFAEAALNAAVPGALDVQDFAVSVVYACGDLSADTPRWSLKVGPAA
jgi:hypothetical protein